MATEMNLDDLDRHITGNYGNDAETPEHAEECPAYDSPYADCECGAEDVEDDRDFDSMPGGWDYEEPDDDFPLAYEYEGGEDW